MQSRRQLRPGQRPAEVQLEQHPAEIASADFSLSAFDFPANSHE
jgi:hypothetical protein